MGKKYNVVSENVNVNVVYSMVLKEEDMQAIIDRKEGWKDILESIKEEMELTKVKYQYIGSGSTLIYWLIDVVFDYGTYCLRCNVTEYNQYTGNEEQYACVHRPMVPYE